MCNIARACPPSHSSTKNKSEQQVAEKAPGNLVIVIVLHCNLEHAETVSFGANSRVFGVDPEGLTDKKSALIGALTEVKCGGNMVVSTRRLRLIVILWSLSQFPADTLT